MFTKYMGQLGKAEAEWICEIQDMAGDGESILEFINRHLEEIRKNCSEMRIHCSRWNRLKRFFHLSDSPEPKELTEISKNIMGCYFANPQWITEGLIALKIE